MARYDPITNVMPLANMVTGAPVSAALGDQIRDNLVALYDGWWFRASKSTSTTITSVTFTTFAFDAIVLGQSAEDDGVISLVSGNVTIRKPGLWLVGTAFHLASAQSSRVTLGMFHSDWPVEVADYVFETPTANFLGASCSGVVEQPSSTAATLTSTVFSTNTITAVAGAPVCWGVWMGERP